MDKKQIDMIACPECHGKVTYDKETKALICESCQLAFPVQDGIPVMLIDEARKIASSR
ncbi:FIG002473: Protein YcaR in KDO2-Lipid A biosynthesis cluster [hydrothermal vent metagenome]|uniref:FIG002473: Protein YcaR in KDO2-Lipid A biosynthesis cluster n=1 Tax=hydrothermal vent metagenome TaxID=652676 RepID=A0A3B0X3Y4_9ZZZZ